MAILTGSGSFGLKKFGLVPPLLWSSFDLSAAFISGPLKIFHFVGQLLMSASMFPKPNHPLSTRRTFKIFMTGIIYFINLIFYIKLMF